MKYRLGDITVKHWNDWDNVPRMPTAIATAVGNAILGSMAIQASLAVATAVGYIAIGLVASWAMKSLAPKMDFGSAGSGGTLVNAVSAAAPQEIVYGKVRKGGIVTYREATGDDNDFLHQIITLAGHEVNSIGDIYINDEIYQVNSDGYVTDQRYDEATAAYVTDDKWGYDSNTSTSKILIKKFLGADNQNVYTTLSALTDGPEWQNKDTGDDTNFKGQGIACMYMRLEYDQDVFADGLPIFTAMVEGKKVYDPRNSTTAYSANAALCIRDYLTQKYGLQGTGDVNDTSFSAAANTCDESVTLSGSGTEARYEMNGIVRLDQTPSNILGDFMTACAGSLFWGQGEWHLKVGEYTSSVKTFTLDDLRGGISLDTKHSRRDNFNIVRGTFNDADQGYITADYPEIRSNTFIADDNNIESPLDLTLPYTTSSSCAQRLAKMTLFRAREQMTFVADFSLEAFQVECGDIVALTIDRYGWSAKEFEVVGWKFKNSSDAGDMRVTLTLRETSSAAFSWSAEESDIKSNDTTLTDPRNGLTVSNLSVTDKGNIQEDGTFIGQALVQWTKGTNKFLNNYEIQYKDVNESVYLTSEVPASESSVIIGPLETGTQYNIRVRGVTIQGVRGSWTAAAPYTHGGDTTAPSPVTGLSATGGPKIVTLDWTAPTTNSDTTTLYDLKGYNIYRATTNSQPASPIAFSGSDKYVDGGLGVNTQYYYWVTALDFTGNESTAVASGAVTTDAQASGVDTDTRIYSGRIFYQTLQAAAPTAPTTSNFTFNVSSEVLTTLQTGWSHSQTSVANSSLEVKEWSVPYSVVVDADDNVDSISFGTLSGAFQITDTIESDNFSAGSAGWQLNSDGTAEFSAAVIRDTLAVGQIPNLSSGKITDLGSLATLDSVNYNTDITNTPDLSSYATTTQLNSKNTVYYQSSTPSGANSGDLWFNTSQGRYYHFNGSSWSQASITADSIVSTYVYTGNLNANNITAGTISVDYLPGLTRMATDTTSGNYPTYGTLAYLYQGQYYNLSANTSTTGILSCSLSNVTAGSKIYAQFFGEVVKNGSQVVAPVVKLNCTGTTSFEQFGKPTESSLNYLAMSRFSLLCFDTSASAGTVTASIDMRSTGSGGGFAIRGTLLLFEAIA